jgi:hypothetical protein
MTLTVPPIDDARKMQIRQNLLMMESDLMQATMALGAACQQLPSGGAKQAIEALVKIFSSHPKLAAYIRHLVDMLPPGVTIQQPPSISVFKPRRRRPKAHKPVKPKVHKPRKVVRQKPFPGVVKPKKVPRVKPRIQFGT